MWISLVPSKSKANSETLVSLTSKTKVPKNSAMHSRTRAFLTLRACSFNIAGVKSLFSSQTELCLYSQTDQLSRSWCGGVSEGGAKNKQTKSFLSQLPPEHLRTCAPYPTSPLFCLLFLLSWTNTVSHLLGWYTRGLAGSESVMCLSC